MARKGKAWSNYGNNIQVVDVVFEVRELDRLKLSEGKDSDKYKKQHTKTVKLINQYNNEVPGGRGKFGLNISRTRHLIQMGAGNKDVTEALNG